MILLSLQKIVCERDDDAIRIGLVWKRLADTTFQTYAVNPSRSAVSGSGGRNVGFKAPVRINQSW